MKTRIHVNQHHIRSNKTKDTDLPVITIKQGRKNTLLWDFLLMGELFQNNHHHAGAKPNFAAKWYEFDPTYPIILFLDKIKVIKLVRVKK